MTEQLSRVPPAAALGHQAPPLHIAILALGTLLAFLVPQPALGAELRVAVASSFAPVLADLAVRFRQETGHTIAAIPGSSGKLATQIRQGAPFDVFLSADESAPAMLEREGLTVAGTRRVYAVGRLALWSRDPLRVDANASVLRNGNFTKLAIADPKFAPYGAAAQEALTRLGLWQRVEPKLVRGENVAQAYQFAATDNAQLAFVALAQVTLQGKLRPGSVWIVPASLHAPIRQAVVALQSARDRVAVQAFLDFLQQPQTLDLLRQAGYEPPERK